MQLTVFALVWLVVAAPLVASGASVEGAVVWGGPEPERRLVAITQDRGSDDSEKCGVTPKEIFPYRLGEGGALRGALVTIEGPPKADSPEPGRFVVDQVRCEYVPEMLLVPVGSTVEFRNDDGILHNVHSMSTRNPPFNEAHPPSRESFTRTFERPEIVKIACDAHWWMFAWIVVHDDPWVAVTDDDGRFAIEGVPEGEWTLRVWQPHLGEVQWPVEVAAGSNDVGALEWAP